MASEGQVLNMLEQLIIENNIEKIKEEIKNVYLKEKLKDLIFWKSFNFLALKHKNIEISMLLFPILWISQEDIDFFKFNTSIDIIKCVISGLENLCNSGMMDEIFLNSILYAIEINRIDYFDLYIEKIKKENLDKLFSKAISFGRFEIFEKLMLIYTDVDINRYMNNILKSNEIKFLIYLKENNIPIDQKELLNFLEKDQILDIDLEYITFIFDNFKCDDFKCDFNFSLKLLNLHNFDLFKFYHNKNMIDYNENKLLICKICIKDEKELIELINIKISLKLYKDIINMALNYSKYKNLELLHEKFGQYFTEEERYSLNLQSNWKRSLLLLEKYYIKPIGKINNFINENQLYHSCENNHAYSIDEYYNLKNVICYCGKKIYEKLYINKYVQRNFFGIEF